MINILTIKGEITSIITDITETFKDIWGNIQGFFLQYIDETTFNILLFGVFVVAILIIVLGIMNK